MKFVDDDVIDPEVVVDPNFKSGRVSFMHNGNVHDGIVFTLCPRDDHGVGKQQCSLGYYNVITPEVMCKLIQYFQICFYLNIQSNRNLCLLYQ